jgi:hypothetical protein
MKKLIPFLLLIAAGCAEQTPGKGPAEVFLAFAKGDGIYILNGNGATRQKVIGGYYYQAVLSPDKTKVACVEDKDFQVTIFDLNEKFESRGRPKTIFNSQALSQGSKMSPVGCPLWSLDGQKIYFLNQNHLIVYDYQEKKTTSLFDFPDNQTGGQTDETGILRLSRGEDTLFAMLSSGKDRLIFWSIKLGDNQGTQVASVPGDSISEPRIPPELSEEMAEAFFGAKENPHLAPIYSPDHRYYFYYKKDSGFLAKERIEGYDKVSKEKFDVSTLSTSLYSN